MELTSRIKGRVVRTMRQLAFTMGQDRWVDPLPSSGRLLLMYHQVLPDGMPLTNLRQISVTDFREQLRYFLKRYTVIPLQEWTAYRGTSRCLAITFDDGLANNLYAALPVLLELHVSATIFITCAAIRQQHVLWSDALEFVLSGHSEPIHFNSEDFVRGAHGMYVVEGTGRRLTHAVKELELAERWQWIRTLAGNRESWPWDSKEAEIYVRLVNEDEIRILAGAEGIEIGSHAVTHSNLAVLPFSEAEEELLQSKDYLERMTGKPVVSLAYPDGSYTRRLVDAASTMGYTHQMAVKYLFQEDSADPRIHSRTGLYSDRSVTEQLHHVNQEFIRQNPGHHGH